MVATRWNRLFTIAMMAAVLVWAGCDSSEDDNDDNPDGEAEMLVGTWNATSVKAGPLDILALTGFAMTVDLNDSGDGTITATEEDGSVTEVSGTYSVDESAKTITLSGADIEDDLVLAYTLTDMDNLAVELEGEDLLALGFDFGEFSDLLADITIDADLVRA